MFQKTANMFSNTVQFADVVEAVMKNGLDDEMDPDQEGEGDNAKNGGKNKNEKKPKQNKSYVTAKTLNDREERRLIIKLNHYQKELKQATYQIDVAQRAIRRELASINPDLMVDPNKGFFIPKGMTQEQAELIKAKRREIQAASNTRSISLDEFTEMRRRKSEMGRQALQAIQKDVEPGEGGEGGSQAAKGRDRWKALAGVLSNNPASFSQMSKVAAGNKGSGAGQGQGGGQQPPATADNPMKKVLNVMALRGATR